MRRLLTGLVILLAVIAMLLGGLVIAAESAWFARWLARQASNVLDREVLVEGPLDIDWSAGPRIYLPPLTVANTGWAGDEPMLRLNGGIVTLDLTGLMQGRVTLADVFLQTPHVSLARDANGRTNWPSLGGEEEGGGPLDVTVDTLRLRDGRLAYTDAMQALNLDLAVRSEPAGDGQAERLHIEGEGSRNDKPFRLNLRGGPLLDLTDDQKPYPIAGRLQSEATELRGDGRLRNPLSPERGTFELTLRGPNPAELHTLLGLSMPDLPPYELHGKLMFEGDVWRFQGFNGTVGDSDLSGDLSVEAGEPLILKADLTSDLLDLDDLLPAFGGAPATDEGETAAPAQVQQAQTEAQDEDTLPEGEADRERLAGLQARVNFRGERVRAPREIPLEEVEFTLRIHDGFVRFDPITFGVGGGDVRSQLAFNVQQYPAQGDAHALVQDVDLSELLADMGMSAEGFGTIRGRLDTHFTGESLDEAFATLEGWLLLYMTGGQINAVLAALAGLDAGQALAEALVGGEETPIECAYAHLEAEQGVAMIEKFLVATEDIDLRAAGGVDLGEERFDLAMRGYPRRTSIGASDDPVQLEGTFSEPEVSIVSPELLTRGAAAAVAALVAPPLAVLPFIELGSGDEKEDVCAALTREAKAIQRGAEPDS